MLGWPFAVVPADVDETRLPAEPPDALVRRLAIAKAEVVGGGEPGAVVIGADTVVVVDDEVFGKPTSASDARRMLRLLSGRSHRVLTGVAVRVDGATAAIVESTAVSFDALTDADIDWYVASGEHEGKAGSYGVQGVAGVFVTRLDGSFTNVIGLPLSSVRRLLLDVDFERPRQAR